VNRTELMPLLFLERAASVHAERLGAVYGTRRQEDVIAHCRRVIAHFKCPKAVEFGPLPKTSTGKVQKFVLRERAWRGHAKRIH